jgi:hypothetical protein
MNDEMVDLAISLADEGRSELRPAKDALADRLEAIGDKMRADLIARARNAATPAGLLTEVATLRAQVAAQRSSLLALTAKSAARK